MVITSISDFVHSGYFSSQDPSPCPPNCSASTYSSCSLLVTVSPELEGLQEIEWAQPILKIRIVRQCSRQEYVEELSENATLV